MIFTAGDSHARWTFQDIPGFDVHKSLSTSITMWRAGRADDELFPQIVADLGLSPTDTLILSCGEIDCRVHVKQRLPEDGTVEGFITGLVDRYLTRAPTFPRNGARLAIMGVVPPVPWGKIFYSGVALPLAGNNEERVLYVMTMNRLLAEGCAARELPFVRVYEAHADAEGLLDPQYSDGNVHVIKTQHVRAELRRLGLIP